MHKKTTYFLIVLFLVAFLGYTAFDRMTFKVPQNPTEGASCDITPGDFTNTGQIKYSANETWWISFTRKEEYLSAFSAVLAITFMGYALTKLRQIGTAATTGGVVGGSILVVGWTWHYKYRSDTWSGASHWLRYAERCR